MTEPAPPTAVDIDLADGGLLQCRALLWPGLAFDFGGGHVYTVPALALGDVEVLQERLAALNGEHIATPESVATVIDATHQALRRNYTCTRAQVAALIDLANMGDVMGIVMDVSGLKRRAQLAAAQGNEAPPAAMGTAGAASTPA